MIAVFGSGFGLYGHLPALVELGRDVHIPARYRSAFDGRAELSEYRSAVHFADDETSLLSRSDLAVLARRPADNDALARQAVSLRSPLQLVIEKPPSPTPESALSLDGALSAAGVRYATPYLLAYCDWARDCKQAVTSRNVREISVDWYFNSQHTDESWKVAPQQGGGPLGYYFIHVIALAWFLLGDYRVIECRTAGKGSDAGISMLAANESIRLNAAFGAGSADSAFSIALDGAVAMTAATPFGAIPRRGARDPRIDVLKRFYTTEVFTKAVPRPASYGTRTLEIWAELADRLLSERQAAPLPGARRVF